MRDDRFGVVTNARYGWANADELHGLGAGCVRTIVYDFDQLEAALRGAPADVRVIALLNMEHRGVGTDLSDLAGWEATVRELAERFRGRIWALECLSQWDRLEIEPSVAVACARSAGRILRETGSGITCLLGSVAGPAWIERLGEAVRLLSSSDRDLLGGACFHPYGRNARGFPGFDHTRFEHGEIDIAVQNAHDIAQMPIWATEFGVTLAQAGGETGQAAYVRNAFELLGALPRDVLAAATYYCWWDRMGAPHERGLQAFGLRREELLDPELNTKPRLAWYAFAQAAGGTGQAPTRFELCPFPLLV
jgi:hypothetical protein